MKKFGYTIPTTWQQWQAIGENVAKNHPGYIIGTLGNSFDDAIYLQAAQCHMNDLTNPVHGGGQPGLTPIASTWPNLLDPLLKDGSVPAVNDFSCHLPEGLYRQGAHDDRPRPGYGGAIFSSTSGLNSPKGTYGRRQLP